MFPNGSEYFAFLSFKSWVSTAGDARSAASTGREGMTCTPRSPRGRAFSSHHHEWHGGNAPCTPKGTMPITMTEDEVRWSRNAAERMETYDYRR
jgi:hypothetical protein